MDEPQQTYWASGADKGPRRLVAFIIFLMVAVGGCAGIGWWLFNSPGFRVVQAIYSTAPDIVNQVNSSTLNGGVDTLTIVVARDVTRAEALKLQCDTVLPFLLREHLAARVVIVHPDRAFTLDGVACPSVPTS